MWIDVGVQNGKLLSSLKRTLFTGGSRHAHHNRRDRGRDRARIERGARRPWSVAEFHLMIDELLEAGRKKLAIDTRALSVIDTVGMAESFDSTRRARKFHAEVVLITRAMIDGKEFK